MQKNFKGSDQHKKGSGNGPPKKNFKKKNFKRYKRADFMIPGCPMGVRVPDDKPGSLEKALRYLKRKMKDEDIFQKLRTNQYFEKPSSKRRKQKDEAIRWQQKIERDRKREDKNHCWTAIIDGQAV